MDLSLYQLTGGLIIGAGIGVLTGIFGVGGGFLLTPALMILLGVSGAEAVGTGLAAILVNSTLGLFRRKGSGTVDVKLALTMASGSIIGVFIGFFMLEALKDVPEITVLGKPQQPVQYVLLWLFLMLLSGIAALLYWDCQRNAGQSPNIRVGLLAKLKIPPYMHFSSLEQTGLSVPGLAGIGLFIGILTGLLGIGGGVTVLPALVYLAGQRTVKAAGTSLLLVWISSLAAVILKSGAGDISLLLMLVLLAGGIAGTAFGTKIGLKLAGPRIRLYFVYVVLAAILMVAYKICVLTL